MRTRPAFCSGLWSVWRPGAGVWPGPAVPRTGTGTDPWRWTRRRWTAARPRRSAAVHRETWTAAVAASLTVAGGRRRTGCYPCRPWDATPTSWSTTTARRRHRPHCRRWSIFAATFASPYWMLYAKRVTTIALET